MWPLYHSIILFLQKMAEILCLYYITIFLFQFMWKKRISIRSTRNKNRLNMTCRINEWMNLQAILKWNKYNYKNNVTKQTYSVPWSTPFLNRFCRTLNKDVVLFASFCGNWFPGAGFACLGRHGSVLMWKYIWIWCFHQST